MNNIIYTRLRFTTCARESSRRVLLAGGRSRAERSNLIVRGRVPRSSYPMGLWAYIHNTFSDTHAYGTVLYARYVKCFPPRANSRFQTCSCCRSPRYPLLLLLYVYALCGYARVPVKPVYVA